MSSTVVITGMSIVSRPKKEYDRHLCTVRVDFALDGAPLSAVLEVPKRAPGSSKQMTDKQIAEYVRKRTLLVADKLARKRDKNPRDMDTLEKELSKLVSKKCVVVRAYDDGGSGDVSYLSINTGKAKEGVER